MVYDWTGGEINEGERWTNKINYGISGAGEQSSNLVILKKLKKYWRA